MQNGWALLGAGGVSFALSLAMTRGMIGLSPRIGFVDKPGHRKIHSAPKPLGGGVAIFWSFAVCLVVGVAAAFTPTGRRALAAERPAPVVCRPGMRTPPATPQAVPPRPPAKSDADATLDGLRQQLPLLGGVLAAALAMHVMGLLDDRRALGPYVKLAVQLGVTAALVVAMEGLAVRTPSLRLRVLTALDHAGLGVWPSVVVTVLWIAAVTNAFNFLDNMDGLSAGVAAVCATAFLVTALSIGQWFVAATLVVFLGSLLGFLAFNFAPARIFMGDSGSLVVGFVLGVLTVRTTFLPPDETWARNWYAVFAPLIVLAVPLYDLVVVSAIRLAHGRSPFRGDTNHFSHRLVARGMSRRTAVLCIDLVTAATSIAAVLLPQVRSGFGAVLIVLQTALVLGVVMLLELHRPTVSDDA